MKENVIFFKKCTAEKIYNLLSPKRRPSYRRSLQPSKENNQHLKTWKFWTFYFIFRVIFALLVPDSKSESTNLTEYRSEKLELEAKPEPKFYFRLRVAEEKYFRLRNTAENLRIRIRNTNPQPGLRIRIQSGQWIRIQEGKMTHKSRNFLKVPVFKCWWPLLRAEGFFCNLDVLYGGLRIGKL